MFNYNNSFRCHEWSDIKFIAAGYSNIIGIKEDNSCVDTVYTDIENNDKLSINYEKSKLDLITKIFDEVNKID